MRTINTDLRITDIDISEMSDGIYCVKISSEKNNVVLKIVKSQ